MPQSAHLHFSSDHDQFWAFPPHWRDKARHESQGKCWPSLWLIVRNIEPFKHLSQKNMTKHIQHHSTSTSLTSSTYFKPKPSTSPTAGWDLWAHGQPRPRRKKHGGPAVRRSAAPSARTLSSEEDGTCQVQTPPPGRCRKRVTISYTKHIISKINQICWYDLICTCQTNLDCSLVAACKLHLTQAFLPRIQWENCLDFIQAGLSAIKPFYRPHHAPVLVHLSEVYVEIMPMCLLQHITNYYYTILLYTTIQYYTCIYAYTVM